MDQTPRTGSRRSPTRSNTRPTITGLGAEPLDDVLRGLPRTIVFQRGALEEDHFLAARLGGGRYGGTRLLNPETVELMSTPHKIGDEFRALGWNCWSTHSSNRGKSFSPRALGHGGFTGTALWIDPGLDLFVIFLANRLHPDGRGAVNPLAGRIGTIAADAIRPAGPLRAAKEIHPVMSAARPNAGHVALADVERMGRLQVLITQNIDGLHQDAGNAAANHR